MLLAWLAWKLVVWLLLKEEVLNCKGPVDGVEVGLNPWKLVPVPKLGWVMPKLTVFRVWEGSCGDLVWTEPASPALIGWKVRVVWPGRGRLAFGWNPVCEEPARYE